MNNATAIPSTLQSDDAVEQIIGFSYNLLINQGSVRDNERSDQKTV